MGGLQAYSSHAGGSDLSYELNTPSLRRHRVLAGPCSWRDLGILCCGFLALLCSEAIGDDWFVETVDCSTSAGVSNGSLALDAQDAPHCVYAQYAGAGDWPILYAYGTEDGWVREFLGESFGAVSKDSLALSESGRPHILYSRRSEIVYAHRTDAGWEKEVVEPTATSFMSFALDAYGTPHAAYGVCSNRLWFTTHYAKRLPSGWSIEALEPFSMCQLCGCCTEVALALDANENPHVLYATGLNGDIRYAWDDGEDWQVETVTPGKSRIDGYGLFLDIAVDSGGRARISYYDHTDKVLRYGERTASGWILETVDASRACVGRFNSLAMTADDGVVIAYFSEMGMCALYGSEVRCARREQGKWMTQRIGVSEGWTANPRLALDSMGQPHVTYNDSYQSGCLRLVRLNEMVHDPLFRIVAVRRVSAESFLVSWAGLSGPAQVMVSELFSPFVWELAGSASEGQTATVQALGMGMGFFTVRAAGPE